MARKGLLTADKARAVIAATVADIYAAGNREELPTATVRSWCQQWLQKKAIEIEGSTHDRYTTIVTRFLEFLGKAADKDIAALKTSEIGKFRDREGTDLARGTANLSLKVLRVCLSEAVRQGLITTNPAAQVEILKSRGEATRRAFTVAEIGRVLEGCGTDQEWRGMVLFGLYTGQRLGDLARLTWRSVDLEKGELFLTTKKTGRRMTLPLIGPLPDFLTSLAATDDPNAALFPTLSKAKRTGTLSNRFREILVAAGLAEPRTHAATGKTRNSARATSEISFHSLRHCTVTFLKAAGVSDALARAVVGHESAAVSRQYTHLDTADLRKAMERMPDVTKTKL
ncbi:MAG: hypothetical protein JWL59_3096 [Chthoniobacteraceae bacterium]|nr:hypothetical protein [Chthoniobacteraceae bacterium]